MKNLNPAITPFVEKAESEELGKDLLISLAEVTKLIKKLLEGKRQE